ncbi:hypothetical protein OKW37_005730 [Paraburkholderia sp. MM5482-R2]
MNSRCKNRFITYYEAYGLAAEKAIESYLVCRFLRFQTARIDVAREFWIP